MSVLIPEVRNPPRKLKVHRLEGVREEDQCWTLPLGGHVQRVELEVTLGIMKVEGEYYLSWCSKYITFLDRIHTYGESYPCIDPDAQEY